MQTIEKRVKTRQMRRCYKFKREQQVLDIEVAAQRLNLLTVHSSLASKKSTSTLIRMSRRGSLCTYIITLAPRDLCYCKLG